MNASPPGRKRLALVIGSGGIKCAAVIGVVQVLEEEGLRPDMVVGCSGGSVFGAAIALGFSSRQMIEATEKAWTADITSKLHYRNIAGALAPRLFKFDETFAFFDDRIMAGNLALAFGEGTTFADTVIPFYCVATDFYTGQTHVITEGPLAVAARLSSGIPLVFGAARHAEVILIDGALSDPLPVDVAIREGADVIVAVGFETAISETVASVGQFAGQMFYILINQLMRKKLAFYNMAHHSEIITVVPDFGVRIGVADVHMVPHVIEKGAAEFRKHTAYLKRLLSP